MFERFTDPARRVIVLAQNEAIDLQHHYIGTEHLLLGLLAGQRGVAARVLQHFGMSLAGTRQEVLAMIAAGKSPVTDRRIPFTPRAKKTLELALREALNLNVSYIGPEHLLLGVIREADGVAAQIMARHGGLEQIRAAVLELLPPAEAAAAARHWSNAAAVASVLRRRGLGGSTGTAGPGAAGPADEPDEDAEVLRATPATDSGLDEAARLAGPGLVGSHHLVLAALTDPGIDLERARAALRDADVTGSTDELPQDAGRRQMLVRVTEDRVTVEMTDEVMIRLARATLHALDRAPQGGGAGTLAGTGTTAGTATGETASTGDTASTGGTASTGDTASTGEAAGTGQAAGMAGAGGPGEIRGDGAASASLSGVWLALRDSLQDMTARAAAARAGEAGSGRKGRRSAT
jgi:Clp amino terminal domain, pathogenicity island component